MMILRINTILMFYLPSRNMRIYTRIRPIRRRSLSAVIHLGWLLLLHSTYDLLQILSLIITLN